MGAKTQDAPEKTSLVEIKHPSQGRLHLIACPAVYDGQVILRQCERLYISIAIAVLGTQNIIIKCRLQV